MNTALNTSLSAGHGPMPSSIGSLAWFVRLCTNDAWAIGSNRPPQGIAIVEGFINYLSGTWPDSQLERGYTVER